MPPVKHRRQKLRPNGDKKEDKMGTKRKQSGDKMETQMDTKNETKMETNMETKMERKLRLCLVKVEKNGDSRNRK